MKNKGFTLVESLLGLTMFLMIFSTLIPVVQTMYRNIEIKKVKLHAMISNLDAVIEHSNNPDLVEGVFYIDGRKYEWFIDQEQVCTNYEIEGAGKTKCVNIKL